MFVFVFLERLGKLGRMSIKLQKGDRYHVSKGWRYGKGAQFNLRILYVQFSQISHESLRNIRIDDCPSPTYQNIMIAPSTVHVYMYEWK